jgi:hypothetical protein
MRAQAQVLLAGTFLAAAALASGCSGSSSGSSVPVPTASATGAPVPVANSSRGSLTLALDSLKTVRYYAQFLRPGGRSTLGWYRLVAALKRTAPAGARVHPLDRSAVPTPNPAPSCDPTTQTALSSTADVSGNDYTVVTAFYPAGDTACSKSPYAVSEIYYPKVPQPFSQGPQLGVGYEATFEKNVVTEFDVISTAIYAAAEGHANVDTQIDRYDASQAPTLTPPPPGIFPATFPLAFPLPNPPPIGQGQSFVSDYYATVETGLGTSTTGTATLVETNANFLPYSTLGAVQNLAAVDSLDVTVSGTARSGPFSYSATHHAPLYAFDVQPITLVSGGGFLGAGKTAWTLSPLVSGVLAANFGSAPSDRATYTGNGSLRADAQTFEDLVNKVTVTVSLGGGGPSAVTATDDLRHAPATTPAVLTLHSDDATARYNYVLDGTLGLVLVDSVAE